MIVHVTHLHHTPTERHRKAYASWKRIPGIKTVHQQFYRRSSKDIRDSRLLPYFKDMLQYAMRHCDNPDDIVLWCNDDVQLDPKIVDWCNSDVKNFGALSMRRSEPGVKTVHMGRELFAFRRDWLDANLAKFPDFIIGSPFFDLIIAAIIRLNSGMSSTSENMSVDMDGCDAKERYAIHEPHQSSWAGANEYKFPANLHNRKLAKEWCLKNMPSLSL